MILGGEWGEDFVGSLDLQGAEDLGDERHGALLDGGEQLEVRDGDVVGELGLGELGLGAVTGEFELDVEIEAGEVGAGDLHEAGAVAVKEADDGVFLLGIADDLLDDEAQAGAEDGLVRGAKLAHPLVEELVAGVFEVADAGGELLRVHAGHAGVVDIGHGRHGLRDLEDGLEQVLEVGGLDVGEIDAVEGVVMDTAVIKTASISDAKIGSVKADKIQAGTISAAVSMTSANIIGGVITGGKIRTNANEIAGIIMQNDVLVVKDGNGVIRVKIGKLN